MKISRLYLKILLAFLAVLIAAEAMVFGFILSGKLPPPFIFTCVEKAETARLLLEDKLVGVPYAQLRNKTNRLVKTLAHGFHGRIWLTTNGMIVADSRDGTLLPVLEGDLNPVDKRWPEQVEMYTVERRGPAVIYLSAPVRYGYDNDVITLHIYLDEYPHREKTWFFNGLLLVTAFGALFIIPVSRTITRPIQQLTEAAERLGKGDFSRRVPAKGKDEVAELGHKFNRMADRLENMVRSGRELTAHLSHELRTPLARMRISLQMMMERHESGDLSQDPKFIDRVTKEIENMDRVIGHILDISKLDLQEPPPMRDTLDIDALLRHIVDEFDPMIEQRGLLITTCLNAPTKLHCHAHGIAILLENIVANAVKYAHEDGDIIIETIEDDTSLTIRICNSHPPLSKKELIDMFTPFQRLSRAGEGGTGLGLHTARKITEIHEGRILGSYENGRVCLTITLPTIR